MRTDHITFANLALNETARQKRESAKQLRIDAKQSGEMAQTLLESQSKLENDAAALESAASVLEHMAGADYVPPSERTYQNQKAAAPLNDQAQAMDPDAIPAFLTKQKEGSK